MASVQHNGLLSPTTTVSSPAASYAGSISSSSQLPVQRQHSLKPGSPKEIALINYVDDKVLYITRRYATKYTNIETQAKEVPGYTSYEQFIADLDPLIDLVWTTGTPTLQIPYMLTFAGLVASYMPAFPFTKQCFAILRKLDAGFASLLRERSTIEGSRHVVSMTEKVRIKSLVDETRVIAVRQASSEGQSVETADESDSETDEDTQGSFFETETSRGLVQGESDSTGMALSKIYETTMTILGDSLARPVMTTQQDDTAMDLA